MPRGSQLLERVPPRWLGHVVELVSEPASDGASFDVSQRACGIRAQLSVGLRIPRLALARCHVVRAVVASVLRVTHGELLSRLCVTCAPALQVRGAVNRAQPVTVTADLLEPPLLGSRARFRPHEIDRVARGERGTDQR